MVNSNIYPAWFSGAVQWGFIFAMTFIAAALGRNPIIYFLLAIFFPVLAPLVLLFRFYVKPKDPAQWAVDTLQRLWVRQWSRKLDPRDFKTPPEDK